VKYPHIIANSWLFIPLILAKLRIYLRQILKIFKLPVFIYNDSMTLKIIFCGTPEFATPSLEALLKSRHQVIAVYTQPDRPAGRGQHLTGSPVKKLALTHHLPVYQPEGLRGPSEQEKLQDFHADVMVVVAYGLLLPKAVLEIPRYGAVNVHPSLLPRWRGSTPIQSAILAGDEITGVSVIQLTPRMDAGPILLQTPYPLSGKETSGQLHDILAAQGAQALLTSLELLATNAPRAIPQNEQLATYTRKISKNDAHIDWRLPASELERSVRAYHPWPIAFTHFEGKILRIWQAEALPKNHDWTPGTVASIEKAGVDIATGRGSLRLLQVQWPGGKPVSVADFIRGQAQHWRAGITRLE
jgi:methionyl-tRNA formyltransferase